MRAFIVLATFVLSTTAVAGTIVEKAADGSSTTYTVGDSLLIPMFKQAAVTPFAISGDGTAATAQVSASVRDHAGNIFTVGPAGEIYRNAQRLTSFSSTGTLQKMLVDKVIQFGPEVFAKGKTDGKWWRWTGSATVNSWAPVTVDFDPAVLN